jgi:hypothetical protein
MESEFVAEEGSACNETEQQPDNSMTTFRAETLQSSVTATDAHQPT